MSREWIDNPDNMFTQINYMSCKTANDQSLLETGLPIPEWDNNNRARESIPGTLGILTGHFPTYAIEDELDENLNDINAFLTQAEALVLVQSPVWTAPEA